jgi:hypothetical protein
MRYTLTAIVAIALQISVARAQTIVALIGDDVLATVDSGAGKTQGLRKIEGIGPVLGIDVRPSDGQLYALASDGTVAVLDAGSGQATPKSKLDILPPEGVKVSVDFNPVADKLRIIGSDGTNLRADVDSGKVTKDQPLKFADDGGAPMVIAASYTNAIKGAKETALFDIEATFGGLFRQAPPNDGILNSIGTLGLDAGNVAFDIFTDAAGVNTGMLIAKGNLYLVNLETGKATSGKAIAGLPSNVRDIAVLPAAALKSAKADTMKSDGFRMKASMASTADYLPEGMAQGNSPKAMSRMQASSEMKSKSDNAPESGAASSMQRNAHTYRMKRRASCDRGSQY